LKIEGQHTISAPRDDVWAALNDPEVLSKSIPGGQELVETGENQYRAKMKIRVGPVQGLFDGNVKLSDSGRLRSRPVLIGGTVFHPLEVPQRIEACFIENLRKAEAIADPFEQAFFAMVHLPYLQPFEDVNKRVSRLSANIPLVKYNLCPLSFIDVPQDDYISGLIGVYELNRIDLLRDVFVWAYRRSAPRYSAVLQSLGDPDPFRLRHRARIGEAVRAVVRSPMGKGRAAQWIAEQAAGELGAGERSRFIEVVETELMSLHEGNIARYRLRPGEFSEWRAGWK
jgi:hypothetical protein